MFKKDSAEHFMVVLHFKTNWDILLSEQIFSSQQVHISFSISLFLKPLEA